MSFEQFGIEFVAKGARSAGRDIDFYSKRLRGAEKTAQSMSKQQSHLRRENERVAKSQSRQSKETRRQQSSMKKGTESTKSFGDSIEGLVESFTESIDAGGNLGDVFNGITDRLKAMPMQVKAATAAFSAFIALGFRGAGLRGIEEGFQETFARIGVIADDVLKDLSSAADGMISEFELMRTATGAVTGITGVVAEELAMKLPDLLEVAQGASRKTGEDFQFLFDSLITGVKRGSPELIDNAELLIDGQAAFQTYADSVGKSVDELTKQEKALATLNAVIEQGSDLVRDNGNANETAADKIARFNAQIDNLLDNLAVNVQPLFEMLVDVANFFVSAISSIVEPIANSLGVILRLFQVGIQKISDSWGWLPDALGIAFDNAMTILKTFGIAFAMGTAAIVAEFINAWRWAKSRVIGVVASIAEAIADFLIGQSPPKKGALKDIDKGGKNIMLAWLGGISSTSLQPITQVARQVDNMMGNIATMSLEQVEARLKMLDGALAPFENRLKIVQARFDELNEPAQQALDAIERQQNQLAQALASGSKEAAQMVRALDSTKDRLQQMTDARQRDLDLAKTQFALAKAAQIEERTKLEIRQAQLDVDEEIEKVSKRSSARSKKASKATGGAGEPTGASADSVGNLEAIDAQRGRVDENTRDFLGGVAGFASDIQGYFQGQLDEGLVADSADAQKRLAKAQAGISKGGGLGGIFGQAFGNIGTSLEENIITPVEDKIGDFVAFFNDPDKEGSIAQFFKNVQQNGFGAAIGLDDLSGKIQSWVTDNFITPVGDKIGGVVGFFNNADVEGSIAQFFQSMQQTGFGAAIGVIGLAGQVQTWLTDTFITPISEKIGDIVGFFNDPDKEGSISAFFKSVQENGFGEALGIGSLKETLRTWVTDTFITPISDELITLLGTKDVIGSIAWRFSLLPDLIVGAIGNLTTWVTNLFAPITNWVTGQSANGGLPSLISTIGEKFGEIPVLFGNALKNIGIMAWDALVKPVIESVNWVISRLNSFLSNVIGNQRLQELAALAGIDLPTFTIDPVDDAPPAALTAPFEVPPNPNAAAKGGLFTGGAIRVGEQGQEIMASATPFAVFSNQFVKAIDMFSDVVSTMSTTNAMNGGVTNNVSNDNRVIVNNSNANMDSASVARIAMLRGRAL